MATSAYLEQLMLDHLVFGTPFAVGNWYVNLDGVSAPDYSRKLVTWDASYKNATQIDWPVTQTSWGTISSVSLYDAPTGGNLLATNSITSFTAGPNTYIYIPAGSLALDML